MGRREVWLDSEFFYVHDPEHIFGYHALRESYKQALARALGLLNGRKVVGVVQLSRSSKRCCRCDRKAEFTILAKYGGKFFGLYMCREHLVEALNDARKRIIESVNSIIDGVLEELEPEREQHAIY